MPRCKSSSCQRAGNELCLCPCRGKKHGVPAKVPPRRIACRQCYDGAAFEGDFIPAFGKLFCSYACLESAVS